MNSPPQFNLASPLPKSRADVLWVATEEICRFAMEVTEMTTQSVGARGVLRPCPLEWMLRVLSIYTKWPHLDGIPRRAGSRTAPENGR